MTSSKNIYLLSLLCFSMYLTSCDIDQTQEAKLPEVEVEAGQLPSYDVDWADIDVGTTTRTVTVPKVRVVMEEEEITVPYIDVDMPNSGEKEELTLVAEAEVDGESHNIEIQEVIATGKKLIVISELKATGQDLQDERMRVSDRLILNAPDLDVKHYIIGERPKASFNQQYAYVSTRSSIDKKINKGKTIYKK
ncbi:MAG: hypothetical protein AB8G15_06445 [Saprospiraceae bacterium]